jgi:eukaryotic-like serine/threonine-protein kinase
MYAMGIVLFQISSLEYPYDVPAVLVDSVAFQRMHLTASTKPLHDLRPELPVGVAQVIAKLVEKRASDRFDSWTEVKEKWAMAWSSSGVELAEDSGAAMAILRGMSDRHTESQRQLAESARWHAESQERRELDEHQMRVLVDRFRAIIDKVNLGSSLGTITLDEIVPREPHSRGVPIGPKPTSAFVFRIPGLGDVRLSFFWIEPPLVLRSGSVRFAGVLEDSRLSGLNLLLVRRDANDLYGQWIACKVTENPQLRPEARTGRTQPFGFRDAREIREIESADRATHIFEIEYRTEVQKEFGAVIDMALRRFD